MTDPTEPSHPRPPLGPRRRGLLLAPTLAVAGLSLWLFDGARRDQLTARTDLDRRLALVERRAVDDGRRVATLEERIQLLRVERDQALAELAERQKAELSSERRDDQAALALQRRRIARLEQTLADRSRELTGLRGELERVGRRLAPLLDPADPRRRLLGLCESAVRVNARDEVGSGVVIFSGRRPADEAREDKQGPVETWILTAWHVIKENLAKGDRPCQPVQVDFFQGGELSGTSLAEIVVVETTRDLALLRLTEERAARATQLLDDARIRRRELLSRVLTVGCPLGYPPLPTRGEVTSHNKEFEGRSFWMVNAPTIFGNSGGPVFDEESGRLLGLLVRIAAYKNVIDVAVPHLGIVTPAHAIRAWLRATPYAFLVRTDDRRVRADVIEAGSPRKGKATGTAVEDPKPPESDARER